MIPLEAARLHLCRSVAPDFWRLIAHYVPQCTSSACSLASITMLVNAFGGTGPEAGALATQASVLDAAGQAEWRALTAAGGGGVTFAELARFARAAFDAHGLGGVAVTPVRPATPAALRRLLAENERSAEDLALVYYNQGVVTGGWDGPHVSVVGAYDGARDLVLILDVDRAWQVPHWTPTATLFAAMARPTGPEHARLAGETGGWLLARAGGPGPGA